MKRVIAVFVFASLAAAQGPRAGRVSSASYMVGADYHATTSDFVQSAFVKTYHNPAVRDQVRHELQGMADAGGQIISTNLWMVLSPESYDYAPDNFKLGFPLSVQDLANIRTYAQDVAAIRATDGHYLSLQFSLRYLWCADYTAGSYTSTVGQCGLRWPEMVANTQQSYSGLLTNIFDIIRGDGRKVVDTVYLDGEVMIFARANQDRFLLDIYPGFLAWASALGVNGSLYFTIEGIESYILQTDYIDDTYSVLNGHRSLYWLYRSTRFMQDNGLPVPTRLDVSFYPTKVNATYATLVGRVWDDIQAVYPARTPVAVAETYYFPDAIQRKELGQAFANEFLKRGMPQQTNFWTTPDGGGHGISSGFPFDFNSYEVQRKHGH